MKNNDIMIKDAGYWIDKLNLKPHPEGGYFSEVYRSDEVIDEGALPGRYSGSRPYSTSIYFLLKSGQRSLFHILKSDEIWHFYDGCPLILLSVENRDTIIKSYLGLDCDKGKMPQRIMKRGIAFAAEPSAENSFSLVGCTVSPGFDFSDFEFADPEKVVNDTIAKQLTNYFKK